MRFGAEGCDASPSSLNGLRRSDLPVVSDGEFMARLEPLAERRRLLGVLLSHESRDWPEVRQAEPAGVRPLRPPTQSSTS